VVESSSGVEHTRESELDREIEQVRRAAAGDVSAYEALYRANVGRVHALCLRMSRDAGEAEELVQDVFVRVWERLASFRGDSRLSTWLHRVAVNVVIEHMRAKGRWRSRFAGAVDANDVADSLFVDSAGADIDLERAIVRLPERARLVFLLHDVEGHKHREIAQMTGLATGTSKAHLHRARGLLREMLRGEGAKSRSAVTTAEDAR
jgi:RNA polymerase sigma-70 factor (ECF subfamily)